MLLLMAAVAPAPDDAAMPLPPLIRYYGAISPLLMPRRYASATLPATPPPPLPLRFRRCHAMPPRFIFAIAAAAFAMLCFALPPLSLFIAAAIFAPPLTPRHAIFAFRHASLIRHACLRRHCHYAAIAPLLAPLRHHAILLIAPLRHATPCAATISSPRH
jgi:hypothetical protein